MRFLPTALATATPLLLALGALFWGKQQPLEVAGTAKPAWVVDPLRCTPAPLAVWCTKPGTGCTPPLLMLANATSCPYVLHPRFPNKARGSRNKSWKRRCHAMHATLREEAEKKRAALVFLGDSLTANLREDSGKHAISQLFQDVFPAGTSALGIPGDSVQHLLYRVLDGELGSPAVSPEAVVVMIGTNNLNHLGRGDAAEAAEVALGVLAVAELVLHFKNRSKVVVLDIPPRHSKVPGCRLLSGQPCPLPYPNFTAEVSFRVAQGVRALPSPHRAAFIQCGPTTFPDADATFWDVDGLHLEPPAYRALWKTCLLPFLQEFAPAALQLVNYTALN